VSPFDHGLLTGDGVFETLRVTRSRPFAPTRHLHRLARSAAGLRLPCPPAELLHEAMDGVIRANGLEEGRLRITLTGGPAALGSDRPGLGPSGPTSGNLGPSGPTSGNPGLSGPTSGNLGPSGPTSGNPGSSGSPGPTLIVAGGPLPAWPPAADVVVAPWPRNERGALAGLKTTSYGENVVALAFARDRDAGEAIFGNLAGNLCEGTGTNVFLGVDGRLVTPPLSAGCLAGVTRDLLLELVDVVEADLPLDAIRSADEAFLTSSTRDVQPIRSVDGHALDACPGRLTVEAAAAFGALLARDLDP
jgi:branched-chain amino acid aminotransferase